MKGYKCDVRNSQEVEQVIQLICQDTELHGSVTTTDNNSAPVRRGVEVHTLVNCAGTMQVHHLVIIVKSHNSSSPIRRSY